MTRQVKLMSEMEWGWGSVVPWRYVPQLEGAEYLSSS